MFISHWWQEVFANKLLVSVKKQQKIELTKEQGWYSQGELEELGWSAFGPYFFVVSSHFLINKWHLQKETHWSIRSKIEGAKRKCKALGSSHFRHWHLTWRQPTCMQWVIRPIYTMRWSNSSKLYHIPIFVGPIWFMNISTSCGSSFSIRWTGRTSTITKMSFGSP